jgi:hypothetical protein
MEEVKKQGMESLFVPYEIALELKELGFDEPCMYYVDEQNNSFIYNFQTHPDEFIEWCSVRVISTPLYQQAFRWLYKQLGRDGFGVMPIDTDKCNEELRKLIEIVKEITPHNHE